MSAFSPEQLQQLAVLIATIGSSSSPAAAVGNPALQTSAKESPSLVERHMTPTCVAGGDRSTNDEIKCNTVGVDLRAADGVCVGDEGMSDGDVLDVSSGSGGSDDGSVVMPARDVSPGVRSVVFGGVDKSQEVSGGSFFSQHVRTPEVKRFAAYVKQIVSVPVPKHAMTDLALVMYTTGAVPTAFQNGGVRIRALAVVGDAAAKLSLTVAAYGRGESVGNMQNAVSSRLSNAAMCRVANDRGLVTFIHCPAGVDLTRSKATADALEALAGVLYLHLGQFAVDRYVEYFGLLN